jgi:diguanylate cyclase (GGDEF)-like protein
VVARDRVYAKDGSIHWIESHIAPYRRADGQIDGTVAAFRTVDRDVLAEQQLHYNANFDSLTGLLNRREMIARLTHIGRTRRSDDAVAALLFCDVDAFKQINDQFGHRAGDQVLQTLAQRLQSCIRHEDLAARMGGDELVVLLSRVGSLNNALTVAEKIRATASEPLPLADHILGVSLSIGVTLIQPNDSVDELIARADGGMYRAKQQGRNCVVAITD